MDRMGLQDSARLRRNRGGVLVLFAVVASLTVVGIAPGISRAAETKPQPLSPPSPPGLPAGPWALAWADEFDGPALDGDRWSTAEPWDTAGFTHADAYFPQPADDLVSVEDGMLHIRTRARSNAAGKPMVSGMATTRDNWSFTHGYLEARVKVPTGRSLWPAFWLLGNGTGDQGWPRTGELDIFEFVNNGREDGIPFMTAHWSADGTVNTHAQRTHQWPERLTGLGDRWVTVGLHRTSTKATVYIDGVAAHSLSVADGIPPSPVFTDPMHVRLETQVGGGWAGHPDGYDEGDFVVDYVRAWIPGTGTTPTTSTTTITTMPSTTETAPKPTTAPPEPSSTTGPTGTATESPESPLPPPAEPGGAVLDDFGGSRLDRVTWPARTGRVAVRGGKLKMRATRAYASVAGPSPVDLRSGTVEVRIGRATTTRSGETFLTVRGESGDEIALLKSGDALVPRYRVDGRFGHADALPYDSTRHRWWRVGMRNGDLLWQTSADGRTWATLGSVSEHIDLADAHIELRAGDYRGRRNPAVKFDVVRVRTTAR